MPQGIYSHVTNVVVPLEILLETLYFKTGEVKILKKKGPTELIRNGLHKFLQDELKL